MAKRKDRKVGVALPRPKPSEAFLASGPIRNAKARARIVAAGTKVVAGGSWPTLGRVMAADRRITSATVERNTDALDPARREWMTAVGEALVDEGTFPTMALVWQRASTVRITVLAQFEDALDGARRKWVAANGPHTDWRDPEGQNPGDGTTRASERQPRTADAPVMKNTAPGSRLRTGADDLGQLQIARLMAERRADRARIEELQTEVATEREKTRRALLGVQAKHAVYLNEAPAKRKS